MNQENWWNKLIVVEEKENNHFSPTDRFSLVVCISWKPEEKDVWVAKTTLIPCYYAVEQHCCCYWPQSDRTFRFVLPNLCTFSTNSFSSAQLSSNTTKSKAMPSLAFSPSSQAYNTSLALLFRPLNNAPAWQRGRVNMYQQVLCLLMLTRPLFAVAGLAAKPQGFAGAYFHFFSL